MLNCTKHEGLYQNLGLYSIQGRSQNVVSLYFIPSKHSKIKLSYSQHKKGQAGQVLFKKKDKTKQAQSAEAEKQGGPSSEKHELQPELIQTILHCSIRQQVQ